MSCSGKIPYTSIEQASRSAKGRVKSGVNYLRVYACPQCGAFHLTSEKPKVFQTTSKNKN